MVWKKLTWGILEYFLAHPEIPSRASLLQTYISLVILLRRWENVWRADGISMQKSMQSLRVWLQELKDFGLRFQVEPYDVICSAASIDTAQFTSTMEASTSPLCIQVRATCCDGKLTPTLSEIGFNNPAWRFNTGPDLSGPSTGSGERDV